MNELARATRVTRLHLRWEKTRVHAHTRNTRKHQTSTHGDQSCPAGNGKVVPNGLVACDRRS